MVKWIVRAVGIDFFSIIESPCISGADISIEVIDERHLSVIQGEIHHIEILPDV